MSRYSKTITKGTILQTLKKKDGTGIATQAYNEMVDNVDYDRIAEILQEYARNGHRSSSGRHYEHKSHRLEKNTYAKVYKNNGIGVGYNDNAVANPKDGYRYGGFVRFGKRGTWTGDDFIGETVENLENTISQEYQRAVDGAIEKQNSNSLSIVKAVSVVAGMFGGFVSRIMRWF